MKGYCKYNKPRVSYRGSSYLSERFGIQSILNRSNKMPIKKNDLILVFVPHDYAQKTGLVESGCLLPLNTTEENLEIIICDFLEYWRFAGTRVGLLNGLIK